MKKLSLIVLLVLSVLSVKAKTTIQKLKGGGYQLLVDDKPFQVKGVTWGYEVKRETIGSYLRELKSMGVNTLRLWGTNDDTQILLDSCKSYGMNVLMGIWFRHGRSGMEGDDNFKYLEDEAGKQQMYDDAIKVVNRWKDHPAVLSWGLGNEVYLNIATDPEKLAYTKMLEKIAKAIKKLDKNHPITSVEAWTFGLDWWSKYAPSIDIYGINCYGGGVASLPAEFEKRDIDKPYIVTEFGVYGEWDQKKDAQGVKLDPTDKDKYDVIAYGVNDWIFSKPNNLGVYVFHFGNGYDFGSTWLLSHIKGYKRPQYYAIKEAFTGVKSETFSHLVNNFKLEDTKGHTGKWINVDLKLKETTSTNLWFGYNQRSGSRKRSGQINNLVHKVEDGIYKIQIPAEDGPLKIYIFVTKGEQMSMATASIVADNGPNKPYNNQVAKAELPFYAYKDGDELPYIASAYMGETKFIGLKTDWSADKHSGKSCIALSYAGANGWNAIGFVDPADDWGDKLGGYNLSGATKFTFWAKSNVEGIKLNIGIGLIGKEKKYHDTHNVRKDFVLTGEWKQYTIDLKGADLSVVRSGLIVSSLENKGPHMIFIDDVVFE